MAMLWCFHCFWTTASIYKYYVTIVVDKFRFPFSVLILKRIACRPTAVRFLTAVIYSCGTEQQNQEVYCLACIIACSIIASHSTTENYGNYIIYLASVERLPLVSHTWLRVRCFRCWDFCNSVHEFCFRTWNFSVQTVRRGKLVVPSWDIACIIERIISTKCRHSEVSVSVICYLILRHVDQT